MYSDGRSQTVVNPHFLPVRLKRSPVKSNANNWSVIVQPGTQVRPITLVLAARLNT